MKNQKPKEQHRRFPKDLTSFVQALLTGLVMAAAAVIILLIASFLQGCQKEVSSLNKPVIEDDRHLMPEGGYNLSRRAESNDLIEASRRGGIKGKPDKPPTTPDEPNNPNPPASGNVLYVDLDGETITNPYWNGGQTFTVRYSGMNAVEVDTLLSRMKRQYEPMGFTVTTDRAVYDAAPVSHRQQIIFTESWEWYGQVGGVAYVGSYSWTNPAPCFVFSSLLHYGGKIVSDAGIHEAGHTLKLRHPYAGYVTYGQWMGAAYYVPWGFFEEALKDATGNTVNQFTVINSNL